MNKKDIKSLIEDINVTLLPSGELLVDTEYANEAKSVRLMDREGFTRTFEEPKTGRWIKTRSYGDYWECDQCGCTIATKHPFNGCWSYNYCPNCGTKMEMGVDPNNCRNCDLANECDLHICIKGVRKRMGERSNERSKRCKGCEYARDRHAQDGWHFHGCFHKPYSGEWIAEIENCPKERSKE